MFDNLPDVLTVEELQSALGIGRSMAYRLVREGDIRHLRIGRNIKIPRRYLVAYINQACYNTDIVTSPPSEEEK